MTVAENSKVAIKVASTGQVWGFLLVVEVDN